MTKINLTDCPAAHSMDTAWFGVDEDGEIAFFETGENGSVPLSSGSHMDNLSWFDVFSGCPKDQKKLGIYPLMVRP